MVHIHGKRLQQYQFLRHAFVLRMHKILKSNDHQLLYRKVLTTFSSITN